MTTLELAAQENAKYGVNATWIQDESLPAFEVRAVNGKIQIAAPNEIEYLYGIYDFAEKYCGYTFFEPGKDIFREEDKRPIPQDGLMIPAVKPLLPTVGFVQEFPFSDESFQMFDWMAKNKMNYIETWMHYYDEITPAQKEAALIRGIIIEPGHHNFNYYIPGKKYAKDHPDFMAMIDGKRITPSGNDSLLLSEQLCTTNPEVRAEFVKRMVEYCKAHPEVKVISLTPNDGFGWCECPECSKFYDKNEMGDLYSVSNHVYKANRIYHNLLQDVRERLNKELPDILLTFAAYTNYCTPAPGMKLSKGLAVNFANYWRCINHTIDDPSCPINSHYASDIHEWQKVKDGGKLWIYEYFMGINFYISLPMVHQEEMFHEIEWYEKNGVDGLITQAHLPHWNVYGMNYYLMGKACRGEKCQPAIDTMYRRLYGKDAAEAHHFWRAVKKVTMDAGACHIPYPYSLFTRTTPEQYANLQVLAKALLAKEPENQMRQALVVWTEYMILFKRLFDKNLAGKATAQDIEDFMAWIKQQDGKRVFVKNIFSYLKNAARMLSEGKRWIHYGLDWEDKVILQDEQEYFQK